MNTWQTTPGVLQIDDKDVVPFMAVKEYEYIRDLINKEGFWKILEWGSGGSTLWFPRQCPQVIWGAIESDPVYYEYLKPKLPDNAWINLNETKSGYLDIIEHYDFIIIDGLYRDECLEVGLKHLSSHPHSQIILHDSGRKAYKDWYSKYPHKIIFEGEGWLGDGWDHRGLTAFGNYE
jgi:hypothetical protein